MISKKSFFYIFLIVYAVADGYFTAISAARSKEDYEACYAIFFLIGVPLPFIWYYLDANARGFQRTTGLKLLIILLALVGIPVYLFKSRSWKKALVGTVIFIFVALGIGVITGIASEITKRMMIYV